MTAPFAIGYWNGNRFVIPGLPQMAAAQTLPATTQQDVEAHQGATGLASPSPFGIPGGGGMERDSGFADPTRPGGAAPAPTGDTKDMGGPRSWGSTLGTLGSLAGFAVPGIGGALLGPAMNLGGSWIDARQANNGLASQGLPRGVNALPAALANGMFGLLGRAGIGTSINDQVGNLKSQEYARDLAAPPNLGFLPGVATLDPISKDMPGWGGDVSGSTSGDGSKDTPDKSTDPNYGSDVWGGGTGGTSYYARGGKVRPPRPGAVNPPGPDDQIAAVQSGEGVLTRAAMKRHPGLLDALNRGDIKKARGLLG